MDAPTLNGLLAARGLIDRAVLARDGTAPGEIIALVLLDLAVESGVKAILGSRVKSGANFQTTIDALNAEHRASPDNESGAVLDGTDRVRELRTLRNGVQHAGNTPSPADVERYRIYAEDFLDTATTALLGTSFRSLSAASLLRDREAREHIEAAERAADTEEWDTVARELAVAFEVVVMRFRATQPWRRRGRLDQHRTRRAVDRLAPKKPSASVVTELRDVLAAVPTKRPLSSFKARDLAQAALTSGVGDTGALLEVLQGLQTEVEFLAERVEAATVVGDPGEHAWFRGRVGRAVPVTGPREFSVWTPEEPLTRPEFTRALAFVITAATRQERLEDAPPDDREEDAWEAFKEGLVSVARGADDGRVVVDDAMHVLGVDDPSRVELALTELVEDGRLVRIAPGAYELPPAENA